MKITALAGGVGAAKFLNGLSRVIDPADLTIVGNTGDDAIIAGLHVSPDLDIVTYTLAGVVDPATGWGIDGDTSRALDQMGRLGADTWFALKDSDLGTHLARTAWLNEGLSLAEITDRIRISLGVGAKILPMSNEPVPTRLVTVDGEQRDFQEYFVKYGHTEEVTEVIFEGAEQSSPSPGVLDAIAQAQRIIICPSNPVISIGPILAVPGITEALSARRADVFAISPIVEGAALKGPADRLLPVVGAEPTAFGVAKLYEGLCSQFVLDSRDHNLSSRMEELSMQAHFMDTIMDTVDAAERLAKETLKL